MNAPAPITDLTTLAKALAQVRRERGLSQLGLDYVAGLASGHTAKLECGTKGLGKISLPLVMQALGVELVVEKTKASIRPLHGKFICGDKPLTGIERKKMGAKKGGIIAGVRMSPQEKRARGRKAAKSRWARARARKKGNGK